MKVTALTVDYQVTRSRDFQSVRLGGSVQLELSESDDKKSAWRKPGAGWQTSSTPLLRKSLIMSFSGLGSRDKSGVSKTYQI